MEPNLTPQNNSHQPVFSTPTIEASQSTPTSLNNPSQTTKPPFNIHDFIKEHKTLSLIMFLVAAILIFVVIILIIDHTIPKPEEPEISPYPFFEHRYLLDYSLGQAYTDEIFSNIGDTILSSESVSSAPIANPTENTYTISLIESSFKILETTPNLIYKVNLQISDERTYILYVYLSGENDLMIAALDRTDSGSTPDHVFVYTGNGESDQYSKEINSWLKTLNLTANPIITNVTFPALAEERLF